MHSIETQRKPLNIGGRIGSPVVTNRAQHGPEAQNSRHQEDRRIPNKEPGPPDPHDRISLFKGSFTHTHGIYGPCPVQRPFTRCRASGYFLIVRRPQPAAPPIRHRGDRILPSPAGGGESGAAPRGASQVTAAQGLPRMARASVARAVRVGRKDALSEFEGGWPQIDNLLFGGRPWVAPWCCR